MSTRIVKRLLMVLAASGLLPALPAVAAPTLFGSNYYDLVLVAAPFTGTNNAWETARDAAAASVFLGASGHLATVTSAAENAFLASMASYGVFTGAWLGGTAPAGWLVGPEAGQAFAPAYFGGAEPNNGGYAYMNLGVSFAGIGHGQWADDSGVNGLPEAGLDPVIGYFVEYETPVPEPAAATLLGLGLLGLGMGQRRRRA